MFHLKTLASVGMLLLTTSAAFAQQPADRNPNQPGLGFGQGGSNGQNNGQGGSNGQVVGVPAPLAAVGLSGFAVAGAYVWIRRRRNRLDKHSD